MSADKLIKLKRRRLEERGSPRPLTQGHIGLGLGHLEADRKVGLKNTPLQ